ncbi:MAG TPA: YceI family protein [Thermodesulfobacteriota bacterium]
MRNRRVFTGVAAIAALLLTVAPTVPAPFGPAQAAHAQAPAGAVEYTVVPGESEARYRVREQLVRLSFPNDAVGTTRAIEGRIVLDEQGRVVPAGSKVIVDLRDLRSDEARRDNYVRRNTLETDRYPTITFVPTELRGLRLPLPQGRSVPFQIVGDLTLRGVTRQVTWEATGTAEGENVRVAAKTAFRFEDFGLTQPRVSVVLSVDETIRLEADVLLRRGG